LSRPIENIEDTITGEGEGEGEGEESLAVGRPNGDSVILTFENLHLRAEEMLVTVCIDINNVSEDL